jgi:alkylated DNA repair dioxygenase AlkB
MSSAASQTSLFDALETLPHGLLYRPDFLTVDEEKQLLVEFANVPFSNAHFQQYVARRRVVRYGEGDYPASYGPDAEKANPYRPFPDFLLPLRLRVANWLGMDEAQFVHALLTEYQPGTPIGWHSDAPHFDTIVGISLAGQARMRFRPYAAQKDKAAAIAITLEPRSAYVMRDDIRWHWQHHIPPTKELRYSITFRSLRTNGQRKLQPAR